MYQHAANMTLGILEKVKGPLSKVKMTEVL